MFRFLFVSLIFFIPGCNNKQTVVVPSFYFWKSNASQLTDYEKKMLDTLKVEKLYVKYFEVEVNAIWGNSPVAKSNLSIREWDTVNAAIIPVVFIRNEVMLSASKKTLDSLAVNVGSLIEKITKRNTNKNYDEVQIDCDWTERSKDNYFYFLRAFKQASAKTVSVTLRLYPYKYPEKMGVPPADKATLMCYNLVNALKNESKNSILDIPELKSYLNQKRKYPLHIDIALPAYSWMLFYQGDIFKGVISQQNDELLEILSPQNNLWYTVTKDIVVNEFYLRTGDKIKYERIEPATLYEAADIIRRQVITDDTITVSVFHLDQQKLNTYGYEVLDSVFTGFSR